VVSERALHLLTGSDANPQLELIAQPAPPPAAPKKLKGTHGQYWFHLFEKRRGLGYCGPLKEALGLQADASIEQIKAALYPIFKVESLSFVSPDQFKAWLTSIGIAPKVPH
jgi:hypothetical protein